MSAIGFGGWPMGGTQYGPTRDAEEIRAIHGALDAGINLFDTAAGYGLGHSEQVLGKALRHRFDDAVVVTKCGISWDAEAGVFRRDSRPATIRAQCEVSLRNLGADRIDLYLIHWPDFDTPINDSMRALEGLVGEGKIRYVGVSNFPVELIAQARDVLPIVTDQIGYHLLDRRAEETVIPYCRANGIGVMAYGSLAHGVLAGAFTPDTRFEADDWRSGGYAFGLPLFHADHFGQNLRAVERLKTLARSAGLSVAQLALRWVLREPAVSTALVGFRDAAEVSTALQALESGVSDDLLAEAGAIAEPAYRRMRAAAQPASEIGPRRRGG